MTVISSENPDNTLPIKPVSKVSWIICLVLMSFGLSGLLGCFLGALVYPFSCPSGELARRLLPEPKLNSFVIRNTLYANHTYIMSLQQGLLNLPNVASIAADPFGFSPVTLAIPDLKTPLVVSGPLRDLYGFPLVPPPLELEDSRHFVQMPGGSALFSFAGFMREQADNEEYEKRQATKSALQKILEKKRLQTTYAWLVISCLGVFLWFKILKEPLSRVDLLVLICIGTITYIMLFVPGSRLGSGSTENDTRLILVEHREAIKIQFREYVEKCFIEGRLDASARDTLLKSLDVPGYPIPEHFNRRFRTGTASWVFFGINELIDRNKRKGFFSVSCPLDVSGAE